MYVFMLYRVHQAEYVIHILAPQEYVNIYSTRRAVGHVCCRFGRGGTLGA